MLVKPDSPNDRAALGFDRTAGDRAIAAGEPGESGAKQALHYGGGVLGGIISTYVSGDPTTGYTIGSRAGDDVYDVSSGQMNPDTFVANAITAKRLWQKSKEKGQNPEAVAAKPVAAEPIMESANAAADPAIDALAEAI